MKISQTVLELQSGHDFVTDRRPGQKQDVSQPYGGRHNNTEKLYFPVCPILEVFPRTVFTGGNSRHWYFLSNPGLLEWPRPKNGGFQVVSGGIPVLP